MPRTVVPPSANVETRRNAAGGGDKFPDKLVKYVPAETLAFFVPASALAGSERGWLLVAIFVIGMIGSLFYLIIAANRLPIDQRPLFHFYFLAVVAFTVWAVSTSSVVASHFGIDPTTAGIALMAAVFVIPAVDEGITLIWRPKIAGDVAKKAAEKTSAP